MGYKMREFISPMSSCIDCRSDVTKRCKILKKTCKKVPAAMIIWTFHQLPSRDGLTSKQIISFLKKRYKNARNPSKTGKSLGTILKCAEEFGLVERISNKYYLAKR